MARLGSFHWHLVDRVHSDCVPARQLASTHLRSSLLNSQNGDAMQSAWSWMLWHRRFTHCPLDHVHDWLAHHRAHWHDRLDVLEELVAQRAGAEPAATEGEP